jgi:peptide/nickel transport system substrate-binding protein
VGCGPFRFAHFDRSREIALEANPDYWDGPPSIDGIVFRFLPDEGTAYQALLREELDLLTVTPALWNESPTAPRQHPLARFQSSLLSGWCVHWNEDGSNPFFLDPHVRRALVLALDRPRFISKILLGFGRSAVGTWHPETAWFDRTLEPWPYDPQLAAKLLTKPVSAGSRRGSGARRQAVLVRAAHAVSPRAQRLMAARFRSPASVA